MTATLHNYEYQSDFARRAVTVATAEELFAE